jgi:hypothetical protein
MNGSMGQTFTSVIAHNIFAAEEKVYLLKSERSLDADLSVLSIRFVSSAVGGYIRFVSMLPLFT